MAVYQWTNTQAVLAEMSTSFLEVYKEVAKTENVTVEVGELRVTLHLPPYAQFIEYGRGPGKFPPPSAIGSWVEVKHIIPRKDTTVPQMVYLISRKIAREGTEGKHAAEKSIEYIKNEWLERIYLAVVSDIKTNIKNNVISK